MFKKNKITPYFFILLTVSVLSFLIINNNFEISIIKNLFLSKQSKLIEKEVIIKKSYLPDYVKGIYLTAYSAGDDEFRAHIIDKIKDSRINTVIIDIKDYSGYILYDSQIPAVQDIKAKNNRIPNLQKTLAEFHELDIYIIARQTVFQDPALAKMRPDLAIQTYAGNTWYDNAGLAWVDPGKEEVWEYC